IEPGIGVELEPAAVEGGEVAFGPLERDEIVGIPVLPRHVGSDDERPVLPVEAAVAGVHHAQILRFLRIESRQREAHLLEFLLKMRPDRDQHQENGGDAGKDALGEADEAAIAGPEARPRAPERQLAGDGGVARCVHATPARKQSWMWRMPSGRRPSSTAKRLVIACAFICPSASTASACGRMVLGRGLMIRSTVERRRSSPIWRRRSPSVRMPTSLPLSSVTPTQPKLFAVITRMASAMPVPRETSGIAAPPCMTSATRNSWRPSC